MESTNLSNLKFEYSYDTQKDDVASDFYEKSFNIWNYSFYIPVFPRHVANPADVAEILHCFSYAPA